jgi:pimeloyl-ACP methyl ester carboxylesterase
MQITDIVKVLQYEDLKGVILVGHSYGGMVITGVADRATDRIANIVYLDAAMPQNGQSLVDVAGPFILAARADGKVVDGVELVLFPGKDPMGYYGVTDPKQIEWMKPKLTPHPWKCFEQKLVLSNEAAMRKLPTSVICCAFYLNDDLRAQFRAMSDGCFWEIDTGHDLMITEPRKVADMLLEIAKSV